jgi:hypothetical protein
MQTRATKAFARHLGAAALSSTLSLLLASAATAQDKALGRIDIHRIQIMAAARWTKPRKCTALRS